jgi:hypothetical protein
MSAPYLFIGRWQQFLKPAVGAARANFLARGRWGRRFLASAFAWFGVRLCATSALAVGFSERTLHQS